MADDLTPHEQHRLHKTIRRIHEQGWGIAVGLIAAVGLFLATNALVIRGGDRVGPHLGLLRFYLPGYSVSFAGSLIGFVYAFVIGYGVGRMVASIYNRLTLNMR